MENMKLLHHQNKFQVNIGDIYLLHCYLGKAQHHNLHMFQNLLDNTQVNIKDMKLLLHQNKFQVDIGNKKLLH
jgi:hypothetical protein